MAKYWVYKTVYQYLRNFKLKFQVVIEKLVNNLRGLLFCCIGYRYALDFCLQVLWWPVTEQFLQSHIGIPRKIFREWCCKIFQARWPFNHQCQQKNWKRHSMLHTTIRLKYFDRILLLVSLCHFTISWYYCLTGKPALTRLKNFNGTQNLPSASVDLLSASLSDRSVNGSKFSSSESTSSSSEKVSSSSEAAVFDNCSPDPATSSP